MGEVGPYQYQVIAALKEDVNGQALINWLNENKFDQPKSAGPIIAHYVKLNHVFVTLKLQKGKMAGELVPIVIDYKTPNALSMSCVPLRLTAVASAAGKDSLVHSLTHSLLRSSIARNARLRLDRRIHSRRATKVTEPNRLTDPMS